MATRFLNSLSSIMYAAQIFGIMPVLHRRGRPRGRIRQLPRSSLDVGTPPPPVTMTVLDLHAKRVFGEEDDANGRVNITTTRRRRHTTTEDTRDYVRSDKSSNVDEQSTGRSTGSGGGSNTSYYVTQFNWKYPNTVYSVLLIVLGVGEWGCTVHDMTKFGIRLSTIGAFNFYTIANFGLIMFFNLARKWTQLHSFWMDTARIFDELPYRSGEINPGVKIRTIFWTWVLVALGRYTEVGWSCVNLVCYLQLRIPHHHPFNGHVAVFAFSSSLANVRVGTHGRFPLVRMPPESR